jgi:hypothetical protein
VLGDAQTETVANSLIQRLVTQNVLRRFPGFRHRAL